jgi:hypothetical protein
LIDRPLGTDLEINAQIGALPFGTLNTAHLEAASVPNRSLLIEVSLAVKFTNLILTIIKITSNPKTII